MKKSCVIYDSWGELIVNLPNEMAGELIKQILSYAFDMEQPSVENPAVYAMFAMIKTKLDEDDLKYQEKVERMKNNSSRNRNDIDTKSEQSQDDIVGVSDSVSVSNNNKKDILSGAVTQIVDYLNDRAGTRFKSNSKTTSSQIKARLNEGFTVEDFKTVIDKKVKAWKNDPKMAQYLRPETLFRPGHFESYLNEIEVENPPPKNDFGDMNQAKYNKIHDFKERQIDYAALQAEVFNVRQ